MNSAPPNRFNFRTRYFLEPWRAARPRLPRALSDFERAAERLGQASDARRSRVEALAYLYDYSEPLVAMARRDLSAARSIVSSGEGRRRVAALRSLVDRVTSRARAATQASSNWANHASDRAAEVTRTHATQMIRPWHW